MECGLRCPPWTSRSASRAMLVRQWSRAVRVVQGARDDRTLLVLVNLRVAGRGARCLVTADITQSPRRSDDLRDQRAHEAPRALVGRLLLDPRDVVRPRIAPDGGAELERRERVELLDADQREVHACRRLAGRIE